MLARQSEIEELEGRCRALAQRAEAARAESDRSGGRLAERMAALEQARDAIGARQQEKHDAQIEALKLGQAQERYRERTAQIREEIGGVGQEAERDGLRLAESKHALARIAERDHAAPGRSWKPSRAAYVAAETALAEQRVRGQQAEREAQDAVFGEREVSRRRSPRSTIRCA